MSALMYSIDQVAQELGMADIVLIRLSQTFKIPAMAYQQNSPLPYKGDLIFSMPDIRRLRYIQDEIQRGKPLKVIQHELQQKKSSPIQEVQDRIEQSKFLSALQYLHRSSAVSSKQPKALPKESQQPQNAHPVATEKTIIKPTPHIKPMTEVAEESFDRYKHREVAKTPVLRNIASQLQPQTTEKKRRPLNKKLYTPSSCKPIDKKSLSALFPVHPNPSQSLSNLAWALNDNHTHNHTQLPNTTTPKTTPPTQPLNPSNQWPTQALRTEKTPSNSPFRGSMPISQSARDLAASFQQRKKSSSA